MHRDGEAGGEGGQALAGPAMHEEPHWGGEGGHDEDAASCSSAMTRAAMVGYQSTQSWRHVRALSRGSRSAPNQLVQTVSMRHSSSGLEAQPARRPRCSGASPAQVSVIGGW
mmetsp:Transcript_46698/g.144279  ORF Transcript_46698/g.144279 Transcript_46698/m.144279 type:complete len:112 (+) Transcript_46698:3-338(+)